MFVDLPNIHIKDIPLGDILHREFGLPVFVRNDAEMACFAEASLGSGKATREFFSFRFRPDWRSARRRQKLQRDAV
jgi:predicted NBD/HSP70 family sugar kinase